MIGQTEYKKPSYSRFHFLIVALRYGLSRIWIIQGDSVQTKKHFPKVLLLAFLWMASSAFAQIVYFHHAQNLTELTSVAEQFLTERAQHISGQAEITVYPLDPRLMVPACDNLVPYLSQGAKVWGRTTVAIRCLAPEPWHITVKANVRVYAPHLAATKALPPGHVITASDLSMITSDITAKRPGMLTDKEHAIGRIVARAIQPGRAIRPEQLRAVKAIQAGQAVRIVGKGNGFVVSGEGHAINGAEEGQITRVKMANGSMIRGIARSDGVIELNF